MATLVLQAAGAFIGGFLGPVGSAVGSAAGAMAGYLIDRALLSPTRRVEGPRLSGPRPFAAEEGASLPRVYGTMRVGGTLIWATRFEEAKTTRRQGGKGGGGSKTTEARRRSTATSPMPPSHLRRGRSPGSGGSGPTAASSTATRSRSGSTRAERASWPTR